MNEHQIKCFLKVVDEGSFSKAAAGMHLSQPAITHQIAALERELDVTLFRRHSAGAELSEMGQRFLPAARSLQAAFGGARASVQKQFDQDTPFVLSVPRAMMMNTAVYQTLMHRFSERFPELAVEVREIEDDTAVYHHLKSDVDCVITMDLGEAMPGRSEMKAFPLFRSQCWIAMGKSSPLYPKEQVTMEDLVGQKLYYARYERFFVRMVKANLPGSHFLSFLETTTPLTAAHSMLAGKACFVSPTGGEYYGAEHLASLKLERELPYTCAFFLRSRMDAAMEAIAEEIQAAHR
ncbi:MAG: LysR family transcriptional regulator [Lachnospiraceae bacterium]|nr:LysR family transcriptional regulator [Lachnospiraceae bacterium]